MNLKKQLFCVYLSSFFSGLRITDAVWVALLAARRFSLWEIGLAEGVFHAVSLLFEVPSGMAADLLGRKRTILCGSGFLLLYNLLMAFAPNLLAVCLAMCLNALANTMFSGTREALVYDSLKQAGQEDDYLRVCADSSQITLLSGAVGSLASLLHRLLRFSGFYLLSGTLEAFSALASFGITEPVVTKAQAVRNQHSLRELPGRFAQLIRDSAAVLGSSRFIVCLIAADAVISVPSYLTKMFIQQRLVTLGWTSSLLFLPLLLSGSAAVLGTEIGRRLHPRDLRRFYCLCALLCGLGTLLTGLSPAYGAIAGSMLVQCVLSVWLLHAERRLNSALPSDQRATLISVDSMAYSLLMIFASPLIGWAGDLSGQVGAGLVGLGVLVMAGGVLALKQHS